MNLNLFQKRWHRIRLKGLVTMFIHLFYIFNKNKIQIYGSMFPSPILKRSPITWYALIFESYQFSFGSFSLHIQMKIVDTSIKHHLFNHSSGDFYFVMKTSITCLCKHDFNSFFNCHTSSWKEKKQEIKESPIVNFLCAWMCVCVCVCVCVIVFVHEL